MDISKQQTAMDDVMACLHLFYVLLFIRARFAGDFTDHSRRGFPQTFLTPLRPAVTTANSGRAADRPASGSPPQQS